MTLYIPKGKDQNTPLPPGFATTFPNVKVSVGQVSSYLIPWDKADIGPRIGLAYNWRPKTVIRLGYGIFYGGEEQQGGNPNRGESAPFNESPQLLRPGTGPGSGTFDPNPFFTNGLQGGFPSNIFSLPAPVSFRSLAPDFLNSLVHKWNAAIQEELPHQMALEVAYVGNHQAHGLLQPDQNACPNFATANSAITCNSLRPQPYIYGLSGTASFGWGNYAGLTTKLDKRLSQGLQVGLAYTYGHALANSGTTLGGSSGFGNKDNTNINESYSSAAWDQRHNVVTSFAYDIPFGRGKKLGGDLSKPVSAIVGNWQINGILTLHTGNPFTIDSNGCVGVWASCFPNLVAGQNPNAAPSGGRSPDHWFNTAAVVPISSLAAPANITEGNLGLQSNWGPPTKTLDFSVFKDFPFTERYKAEFRMEATNLFNTPQFSGPDNNASDHNFGVISSTAPGSERHIQFSLRMRF
jgi:hypothetical protein